MGGFHTKKMVEISDEMSARSKRVPITLLHYLLTLSVVRANHSDITHQPVRNSLTLVCAFFIVPRVSI